MSALDVDTTSVPPFPDDLWHLALILEQAHPEAEWLNVLRCCWVVTVGQRYETGLEVICGLIIRGWLEEDPAGPIYREESGARYRLSDEGRAVARTVPR